MGIETIIGAIGVAASVGGTIASASAQADAADAAKQAEKARFRQMELEGARQRREVARRATMARATALSNATNQGAALGSGLQGGFGQIQGQAGNAMVAVNQNQEIGGSIFKANMQQYQANSRAATASGIASFGGMLMNNQSLFGRIGSFATGIA